MSKPEIDTLLTCAAEGSCPPFVVWVVAKTTGFEAKLALVETSKPELYESYVPVQRIPLESNASVVNGLYADSSISSPYLLGLEKEIAKDPVPNPIAANANLTQKQIRKRMAYLDIEHALVRTDYAR
ncbi:MAG: hypothetical protein ABEJ99_06050, partial [Candidatus Nanohaloarchaea archaeon]